MADTPPAAGPMALARKWLRPALSLLSVAALVYLGSVFVAEWSEISEWRPGPGTLAILAGFALIYGAALFLVAEIWHGLATACSGIALGRTETFRSITDTQLAKYLPGNVAHIIGRHAWLKQAGPSHRALALAFALEVGSLVAGAGIVAALVLWFTGDGLVIHGADLTLLTGLVLGAAAVAGLTGLLLGLLSRRYRAWVQTGFRSVALSIVFFAAQGALFWGVALAISPDAGPVLIGISALAWVGGFLMPGAPGGLGPREFILLALAGPLLGPADAALAAAVFRVVTFAGDAVCFGLGRAVFNPAPPAS